MADSHRGRQAARERALEDERAAARRRLATWITAAIVGGVVLLGLIFLVSNNNSDSSPSSATGGQSGQYRFAVGQPGPGAKAPPIQLPSTAGGSFDLAAQRGKTVLLYFQEGLTCEPCWTQLVDLDRQMRALKAYGVDELVTITSDPLDQLSQKVADEGVTTPVLSDSSLAVSGEYSANRYGMMGSSRDGHTFIAVGPDGRIEWRADYGGAPDFTMYVPVPALLADLQVGLLQAGAKRAG